MKEITKDMIMFWLGSTRGYERSDFTENNAYDVIWELFNDSNKGCLGENKEDVIETWEEAKEIENYFYELEDE